MTLHFMTNPNQSINQSTINQSIIYNDCVSEFLMPV